MNTNEGFLQCDILTNTPWGYILELSYETTHKTEVVKLTAEYTCCNHKTKERSQEEIQKLIHRLNRIEGQVRGVRGMVERNAYCTDILVQSMAVSAAISAFNKELLSEHIHTCVADNIRAGNDQVIDELIDTLKRMMK